MTIYEKALEFIKSGDVVGLGSGRASTAFIKLLGEKVKAGFKVQGVPTSEDSASLARSLNIPLITLQEALGNISCAIDGADEVDPNLNLIKGYGRALVREKIIAASAKKFIILVGDDKIVSSLGSRGKLPVEVVPFGVALVKHKLHLLGIHGEIWMRNGTQGITDNGNLILDCVIPPTLDPAKLEIAIRTIPGVVDTGFFIQMADVVLVGDSNFNLTKELFRK
ncbi:MAG: ribose-5-phosphate isomerase RpiA [Planctomycetota bacterium]|nr:ribose-5-phosphate isomerase RpiA [Planctomycetota bacterium]